MEVWKVQSIEVLQTSFNKAMESFKVKGEAKGGFVTTIKFWTIIHPNLNIQG